MEVVSASGQALRDLASSLMALERQPILDLRARQGTLSKQRDSYRDLSTKLSSLRRLVQDFAAPGSLSALRTMKVGDHEGAAFAAVARFTADSGRHDIQVLQLAARHGVASSTLAADETSLVAALGPGESSFEFRIEVAGESHDISVAVDNAATDGDILTAVVEAVQSAGIGVQASLVSVGKGQKRLLIQATAGGEAGRINSITDVSGNLMAKLGLAGGESGDSFVSATVVAPSDAIVLFDGVEIRSDSNTLSDVVPGVTLTLQSTSDSASTLSVDRDTDAALAKVKELIAAYNATIDEVYNLTRPADETGQSRGVLAGTSGLGSLRNSLRLSFGQGVSIEGSSVGRLGDLGISADRQGRLSVKDAEFREVLQSDPAAVEELFNGENGLAVRLEAYLDRFLDVGGVIDQQRDAAQSRVDLYARRIRSMEEGLASREKNLLQQLAVMQAAIGALLQQQSYLGSIFSF